MDRNLLMTSSGSSLGCLVEKAGMRIHESAGIAGQIKGPIYVPLVVGASAAEGLRKNTRSTPLR